MHPPASGLVQTWWLFVYVVRQPPHAPAPSQQPSEPAPLPPAALPLLRPSLLSFSFDASVNRDTESISLLASRCHLHRDINSEKLLTSERRGACASGFWVHYLEILWTVNEFQFCGLVINEQLAGLRHDAN